jgi:hypothetical protein
LELLLVFWEREIKKLWLFWIWIKVSFLKSDFSIYIVISRIYLFFLILSSEIYWYLHKDMSLLNCANFTSSWFCTGASEKNFCMNSCEAWLLRFQTHKTFSTYSTLHQEFGKKCDKSQKSKWTEHLTMFPEICSILHKNLSNYLLICKWTKLIYGHGSSQKPSKKLRSFG